MRVVPMSDPCKLSRFCCRTVGRFAPYSRVSFVLFQPGIRNYS